MHLSEIEIEVPSGEDGIGTLARIRDVVAAQIPASFSPTRFVVTKSSGKSHHCEVGGVVTADASERLPVPDIFEFKKRQIENSDQFNAVFLIPTGVGAELGGHAGDAGAVAKLFGQVCDNVILHPNVVNASDINEMPGNALYVEGSVITRLMMGTVGLQKVRTNRVLVVIDAHQDEFFTNAAINAVNAARATYGLDCPEVVCLNPPVRLRARFATSGRAAGRVESLAPLHALLEEKRGSYDAVAVSSVVDVPPSFHQSYFDADGEMVNPWGGVEAMLTHALSNMFDVPTAHSPMFESREIANADPGVVDPRMSAEATSVTFLPCILKGLMQSPRIVNDVSLFGRSSVITAEDISCLVLPDRCVGLPTLAALEHGIPVIAVKSDANIMENDLTALPWRPGQLQFADTYLEAAGILSAMRCGVSVESCRRPISAAKVSHVGSIPVDHAAKTERVSEVADN